jgi:hypothetical protein
MSVRPRKAPGKNTWNVRKLSEKVVYDKHKKEMECQVITGTLRNTWNVSEAKESPEEIKTLGMSGTARVR